MRVIFFLLTVLCLDIVSHEAPKNNEEKQFYVDNFIEISNVRSQYINTYWAIPILGFAQILAIPIHPFIQYRIAQYGMRPY